MIHDVTCTYCEKPIMGRIIKDEFNQTTCIACLNGEPITPVVTAPIVPTAPRPRMAVPPPEPASKRKERAPPPALVFDCNKPGCAVVDCQKPVRTRHLCCAHYFAATRSGQIDEMPKLFWVAAPENIDTSKSCCIAIGCTRSRKTRGFCYVHYNNVCRNKQTHLLLPPIPNEQRNAAVRHTRPVTYLTPLPVMREIIRNRLSGHSWHKAAILAGAEQPLCAANRTKNLFRQGKISTL